MFTYAARLGAWVVGKSLTSGWDVALFAFGE
jgi:hypothetical protein